MMGRTITYAVVRAQHVAGGASLKPGDVVVI
jgi:hypothetical protein